MHVFLFFYYFIFLLMVLGSFTSLWYSLGEIQLSLGQEQDSPNLREVLVFTGIFGMSSVGQELPRQDICHWVITLGMDCTLTANN